MNVQTTIAFFEIIISIIAYQIISVLNDKNNLLILRGLVPLTF